MARVRRAKTAKPQATPMMGCGHAANARTGDGQPCCVICYGLHPGASTIKATPILTGREAECAYCRRRQPSSPELAFFEHRPSTVTDLYYCGCRGWD